jgi:hypothetical protein
MAYHPEQLSIKALNQQTPPEYKRHQTATTRLKSKKFGKQLQVLNELLNHQEQSPSNLHVVNQESLTPVTTSSGNRGFK